MFFRILLWVYIAPVGLVMMLHVLGCISDVLSMTKHRYSLRRQSNKPAIELRLVGIIYGDWLVIQITRFNRDTHTHICICLCDNGMLPELLRSGGPGLRMFQFTVA